MEAMEDSSNYESGVEILGMFRDFMARVTEFEEQAMVGSKLLSSFQQGLELLRRNAIDTTAKLIENVVKANETERLKLYFEANCIKNDDAVLNVNKSKSIVNYLESILEDVNIVLQKTNENNGHNFNEREISHDKGEEGSNHEKADMTLYASLMAVIYCNIKQDYMMREKIGNALKLTSTSGELETYCLMWSLHPFIDDEIMQSAWNLIS